MEVKSNRKNSRSGGSSNAKHVYVPKHSAQKKTPPVFTVPVEQTDEPLNRAIHQCNDLIVLQGKLLEDSVQHQRAASELTRNEFNEIRRQLEAEKVEHARTKYLLSTEQEKAQLALTEVQVLTKQLDREQATFEQAFGLLKSQALSDSSKSESLLAKCTGLETLCAKKDEKITKLEVQVQELTKQLKELKQAHKMDLQEANVRAQQELYLANHYREKDRKWTTSRCRIRGKTKLKDN